MLKKKSATAIGDEKKQAVNLYDSLVNDSKSAFYATDKITKTHERKARNSYKKDIVFVNIYNGLENKKFLPEKINALNAPFVEKKRNIIQQHIFGGPFEALQADTAYISFLAR